MSEHIITISHKRILFVGRPGVGKTTTIYSVFGIVPTPTKESLGRINCKIEEVGIHDDLTIYKFDIPVFDDDIWINICKRSIELFTNYDIIVYVFNAGWRDTSYDFRFIERILPPLLQQNPNLKFILGFNQVDLLFDNKHGKDVLSLPNGCKKSTFDILPLKITKMCERLSQILLRTLPIVTYSALRNYNTCELRNKIVSEESCT